MAPYLLNLKKLPPEQVRDTMKNWLDRCDKEGTLDFNVELKIKEGIRDAEKGYFPICFECLKTENPNLYDMLEI